MLLFVLSLSRSLASRADPPLLSLLQKEVREDIAGQFQLSFHTSPVSPS